MRTLSEGDFYFFFFFLGWIDGGDLLPPQDGDDPPSPLHPRGSTGGGVGSERLSVSASQNARLARLASGRTKVCHFAERAAARRLACCPARKNGEGASNERARPVVIVGSRY